MRRMIRGLKSIDRLPEISRCTRNVREYLAVIQAFLGLRKLRYPIELHDNQGQKLIIYDFEDLTTLWAVWCADEYRVPSDALTVIDAGANIGAFSLFAKKSAPQCQIVAIEPFPSTFDKLVSNITRNNMQNSVTCKCLALGASPGHLFMSAAPEIKSHSRKTQEKPSDQNFISVECVGLESIVSEFLAKEVDYLKIDIEGGEVPFIVDSDRNDLRLARKIGIECHSIDGRERVWAKLEQSGFKLDRVSRGSLKTAGSTAEFLRV
ncbi:methyltransferase, FkbM family [Kaistia soli DSM 19436]|uniref:Methyltransferase, FkbM family n=1 Tax=Kaistia soli DSM 19436 TaxID=1122133 RepID=A0A1M5I680_9HYPH|nr:FkbM family methyltransferase [Kaistia soli]SHG23858.1 methyltransferase, FkbM family [Kaistia soli DSM 19436]